MEVGQNLQRKKTRVAELPDEVLRLEILTRLPIKSAVRFKCVSKSWLSLFSDPHFAKEHLARNTTQNPNGYDCLIAKKCNKISILSRYKETLALKTPGTLTIGLVGCVRGLVCLLHNLKLSLWNPAIHQSKEFTLPSSRCRDHKHIMGFGFDPVSDNYKVVVLSRKLRSASVYSSNDDSWIDVFVPDNVYHLRKRGNFLNSSITIVEDCPYWTFFRTVYKSMMEKQLRVILTTVYLTAVKFDVGSNQFKLLPEFFIDRKGCGRYYGFSHKFVDMSDCLTVILCDRNSSECVFDIYSLDGEEGCCAWSKMYNIGPLDFGVVFVSQGFNGSEILFHGRGMFSCYDHKTDTITGLISTTSTLFDRDLVSYFRYKPSLVFLEGMKYVYLTTQTRRTSGRCYLRRLFNSLGH